MKNVGLLQQQDKFLAIKNLVNISYFKCIASKKPSNSTNTLSITQYTLTKANIKLIVAEEESNGGVWETVPKEIIPWFDTSYRRYNNARGDPIYNRDTDLFSEPNNLTISEIFD